VQFWRTGPRTIRGYARSFKFGDSQTSILITLSMQCFFKARRPD
jgi:hypothetical protein